MENGSKKDKIITITLLSLIAIILAFIIMIIYIPKLSTKVLGFGTYQALSGYDSTLNKSDMLIVKEKPFDELTNTDIIVFKLEGYGNSDGYKAYKVMAKPGEGYYHVHSTGEIMSFPWNITEEMYIGVVTSKIPVIGAIAGFIGSWYGLVTILVNGVIIGVIVYLVKSENKKEEDKG